MGLPEVHQNEKRKDDVITQQEDVIAPNKISDATELDVPNAPIVSTPEKAKNRQTEHQATTTGEQRRPSDRLPQRWMLQPHGAQKVVIQRDAE